MRVLFDCRRLQRFERFLRFAVRFANLLENRILWDIERRCAAADVKLGPLEPLAQFFDRLTFDGPPLFQQCLSGSSV